MCNDEFWQDDIEITICRNDDVMVKKYKHKEWLVISSEDIYRLLTEFEYLFDTGTSEEFKMFRLKQKENTNVY